MSRRKEGRKEEKKEGKKCFVRKKKPKRK